MRRPKRIRVSPRIRRAEKLEMSALAGGKSHAAAERIEKRALSQPVTRSSGRGGRTSAR
jgi:hypothetical protein